MWWDKSDFVSVLHVTSSTDVCELSCCVSAWDWSMLQWEGVSDSVCVVMRTAACASAVSEYWMRHRGLTLMTLLDAESCADWKSADILHSPEIYSASNKRLEKTCYGACHKMHMSAFMKLHPIALFLDESSVLAVGSGVGGVLSAGLSHQTDLEWGQGQEPATPQDGLLAWSHSKPLETCCRSCCPQSAFSEADVSLH